MTALRRLVQLALAALLASAGGGLVLVLLLALAGAAAASGPLDPIAAVAAVLAVAVIGGGAAVGPAVGAAWLPAFAAGTALWAAGRTRRRARSRLAWAAAGAAVALICRLRLFPGPSPLDLIEPPQAAIMPAFLLAGALAGQAFRSAMAAAAAFLGLDEDGEEPDPFRRSLCPPDAGAADLRR